MTPSQNFCELEKPIKVLESSLEVFGYCFSPPYWKGNPHIQELNFMSIWSTNLPYTNFIQHYRNYKVKSSGKSTTHINSNGFIERIRELFFLSDVNVKWVVNRLPLSFFGSKFQIKIIHIL